MEKENKKLTEEELFEANMNNDENWIDEELKKIEYVKGIRKIYNLISYPIMIIHELIHMLFGIIFGLKIEDSYVSSPKYKKMYGYVEFDKIGAKTKFGEFFISLSPILIILIPFVLSFFYIYALPFLAYSLITFKSGSPSKIDLARVAFHKELILNKNEEILKKIKNITYYELIKKIFYK